MPEWVTYRWKCIRCGTLRQRLALQPSGANEPMARPMACTCAKALTEHVRVLDHVTGMGE